MRTHRCSEFGGMDGGKGLAEAEAEAEANMADNNTQMRGEVEPSMQMVIFGQANAGPRRWLHCGKANERFGRHQNVGRNSMTNEGVSPSQRNSIMTRNRKKRSLLMRVIGRWNMWMEIGCVLLILSGRN